MPISSGISFEFTQYPSKIPDPPPAPTGLDTLGAAFRLGNGMVNTWDLLTQPGFKPDPTFDLTKKVKESGYWEDYRDNFLGVRSEAEFNHIAGRIEQEQKDKDTYSRSGWGGIAAGVAAGLFDPTMLIPIVGEAKGVRALFEAAALGAGATALAEIPLQANQETRTAGESALNIGFGTILGGILGGAVSVLRPGERAAIEEGMVVAHGAKYGPSSVGAASGLAEDAGTIATAAARGTARMLDSNPVTRSTVTSNLMGEFGSFRWGTAQVDDAGLALEKNALGVPTTPGGTALNRLGWWRGNQSKFDMEADDAFVNYSFDGSPPKFAPVLRASIAARFSEAKMSRSEFHEQVALAVANKGEHENVHVRAAAKAAQDRVFTPIEEGMTAKGMLTKEMKQFQDPSYITHLWSQTKIQADLVNFIEKLTQTANRSLQSDFAKQLEKFQLQQARGKQLEEDLLLPSEQIAELRDKFTKQLADEEERGNLEHFNAIEDQVAALRASARQQERNLAGRAQRRELLVAARDLEKGAGEAFAGFKANKTELRRRLSNLSRARVALEERQAAKLASVEKTEDMSLDALNRAARAGYKFLSEMEGWTDDVLDKELSELKTRFAQIAEQFDKGEEKIGAFNKELGVEEAPSAAPVARAEPTLDPKTLEKNARMEVAPLFEKVRENVVSTLQKYEGKIPSAVGTKLLKATEENTVEAWDDFTEAFELWEKNAKVPEELSLSVDELLRLQNSPAIANKIDEAKPRLEQFFKDNVMEFRKIDLSVLESWLRASKDPEAAAGLKRGPVETSALQAVINEKRVEEVANVNRTVGGVDNRGVELQRLQEGRSEKLTNVAEKIADAEDLGRPALRSLIDDMLQASLKKIQQVNARRALRSQKLKEAADALDPAQATARVEGVRAERAARAREFTDALNTKGAEDINLEEGSVNFLPLANSLAHETKNKIMGTFLRSPTVAVLQSERGAMLARTINMSFQEGSPWLETDIRQITQRLTRSMAPDIELVEKIGDVNGDLVRARAADELKAKLEGVKNETKKGKPLSEEAQKKRASEITDAHRLAQYNFDTVIERIRGTRGMPSNPDGMAYRMGRTVLNFNVLTKMGGVVVASVSDVGRPVMRYGLTRVMRDAYLPLIFNLKQMKMSVREGNIAGVGLDAYNHQRAETILDLLASNGRGSKFEKGVEYATRKTGIIAGFDYWTDAQKGITSMVTIPKLTDSIMRVAEGKATTKEIEFLASNGLDAGHVDRIVKEMQRPGGADQMPSGVWLPNTEAWKDREAQRAFSAAVHREINNTIVTPGLERPAWTDANMNGRIVSQFKSFAMASTYKTVMSGMQQRDSALVSGVLISLALGTFSYYLWGMAGNEERRNKMLEGDPADWADQAIQRSGLLGIFGLGQDIVSRLPFVGPYSTFSGQRTSRRGGDGLLAALAGPTYGTAGNVASILEGLDDPTKSTVHKMRTTLIPYNNVSVLSKLFDAMEGAIPVQERRN